MAAASSAASQRATRPSHPPPTPAPRSLTSRGLTGLAATLLLGLIMGAVRCSRKPTEEAARPRRARCPPTCIPCRHWPIPTAAHRSSSSSSNSNSSSSSSSSSSSTHHRRHRSVRCSGMRRAAGPRQARCPHSSCYAIEEGHRQPLPAPEGGAPRWPLHPSHRIPPCSSSTPFNRRRSARRARRSSTRTR